MGHRLNAAKKADSTSRHLRWESFEARIRDGPPSLEPITGVPRVVLFIEPGGIRIGARYYMRTTGLPTSPLAEVTVRQVGVESETAIEISTGNAQLYREFYALCCDVADRVQQDKETVGIALSRALRSWSALVRRKPMLSTEEQIGLIGELLFLKRVAGRLGWMAAANAWQGPGREEHDFVLPKADVEVKTTSGERRVHYISSLTQMLPKPSRPLYVLSIQLTMAAGSPSGLSLPRLVADTLAAAGANSHDAAEVVRVQLERLGWDDDDAASYPTRFQLRDRMMAIPVDGKFPGVIPDVLKSLGPDRIARIECLSYSVNLDGLGVPDGTRAFEGYLFPSRKIN